MSFSDYTDNISYLFFPFECVGEQFLKENALWGESPFIAQLSSHESWKRKDKKETQNEIGYMQKYVSDKIDTDNPACQCFHYELRSSHREQYGLGREEDWFHIDSYGEQGEKKSFRFQIGSVEMFCFSTTVGIVALKIHFEDQNPLGISSAQYYLKKVSQAQIFSDRDPQSSQSVLDFVKNITSDLNIHYFYFANERKERSNMLTLLTVKKQPDYKRELFYLRRCYNDSFFYNEDPQRDKKEIHVDAPDILWGISSEAAVCLVCPEMGKGDFIKNSFFANFNSSYLFMYVWLLHQKYVLYKFLTDISGSNQYDLKNLVNYQKRLYEFEKDFVYSCITEVPQYEILYEKMTEIFELKNMYEDVHEPLISLADIKAETEEKKQKKRDKNVDRALILLSLLSFFSALVDSFDFADSFFGWFLGEFGVKVIQVTCIGTILLTLVVVLYTLLRSRDS